MVIIFVALRCWSRYTVSKEFWWDDWFLLGSTTLFLTLQGVNIWGVKMGPGVHVWNVNPDLNVQLYQVAYTLRLQCRGYWPWKSTNGYTKSSTSPVMSAPRHRFSCYITESFHKIGCVKQSILVVCIWCCMASPFYSLFSSSASPSPSSMTSHVMALV